MTAQPAGIPMPAVRLQGVQKWYGAFEALKAVSLDVAPGEKVVICGPSGSGKSTLIRCINRLETHDGGTIVVGGTVLDDTTVQAIRRRAGMVFQQFNLFPHLTVLENCTLAQRLVLGRSSLDAERVARAHLERVRIGEQASKYPGQLSGGQQQRAAIARCLSMDPELLLLDEPTSALDPEMINEVLDVMADLARDGRTMLCVTHEMGFARRIADRIVFMDAGTIVEQAPPEQFFGAPKAERARQFLSRLLAH
jgi:ABC-type polar amino acid transport system ATPase subunit